MNAPQSNAIHRAKLYRKIGYGFFLFLITWSIVAAVTGVSRSLIRDAETPVNQVGTP